MSASTNQGAEGSLKESWRSFSSGHFAAKGAICDSFVGHSPPTPIHLGRQQRIETGRSASGQNDAVQTFLQAPIPCLDLWIGIASLYVWWFPFASPDTPYMRTPGYPGFLASPSLWPEDQEFALRGSKMDTGRTVLIRTDVQLFGH